MSRSKLFYIYAIQMGDNREVVYLNYSTDVQKSFRSFVRKHPQLKRSQLRPDLVPLDAGFKKADEALRTSTRMVRNLFVKGVEVIAGAPVMNNYWSLYVIELDGDPRHVYVGQTNYPIEKRLQQHIYKFNPARELLKTDNFRLMEELCRDLPIYKTQDDALIAEDELAIQLRGQGYRVEGGH